MSRRALATFLAAAALLSGPPGAAACGPSFPEIIFSPRGVPAVAPERFLDGELGILRPHFGVSDLWPAYRILLGRPLTPAERQALRAAVPQAPAAGEQRQEPIAEWLRERAAVPGAGDAPPGLANAWGGSISRTSDAPGEWFSYVNCPEDAFRTASRTLRDRSGHYGRESPALLAWLRAQDAVFANCRQGRTLPEPAAADADPLARADRAYQTAAAHFYAEDYEAAEQLFRAIGADAASPWRDVAAYLVGRTLLRRATVRAQFDEPPDRALLEAAGREFSSLLADPARAPVHGPAAAHLRLVQARLDRDGYVGALAASLSSPADDAGVGKRFREYQFLLGDGWGWADEDGPATGDLTAWTFVVRAARAAAPAARRKALAAWRQSRSLPWLCAALMTAAPGGEETAALLEAAAAVPRDSPAYPTAAYHRVRLLVAGGAADEGRALATRLLEEPGWSPADRNLLLAERLKTARTLAEFLADAQRQPVGVAQDGEALFPPRAPWNGEERFALLFDGRWLLDRDAGTTIGERFPLALLRQVVAAEELPAHIRRDLAVALFARAVMLGDHENARAVAPLLAELAPEIGDDLRRYREAQGAAGQAFAAALLVLRAPGVQPAVPWGWGRRVGLTKIDRFRDNWWGEPARGTAAATAPPAFLTAEHVAAADGERDALARVPAAPRFLGEAVLAWAREHRDDPRVPEALHLVVRATRFGVSPPKSPISREAFILLHERYPRSEWTAKTPYWY